MLNVVNFSNEIWDKGQVTIAALRRRQDDAIDMSACEHESNRAAIVATAAAAKRRELGTSQSVLQQKHIDSVCHNTIYVKISEE